MSNEPTELPLGGMPLFEGNRSKDSSDPSGVSFVNFDEPLEIIVPPDYSEVAVPTPISHGHSSIFELPLLRNDGLLAESPSSADRGLQGSHIESATSINSSNNFMSESAAMTSDARANSSGVDALDRDLPKSDNFSMRLDVGIEPRFSTPFSGLADSWDAQVDQAMRASDVLKGKLETYVDEGGNWVVAAFGATALDVAGYAMSFTQSLADTSRLGQGLVKGSLEGAHEDLERALNVLPQWKIVKVVGFGNDILNVAQAAAHGDIKGGAVAALSVAGAAGASKSSKLSGSALKKKQDTLHKNKITGKEFEETIRPAYEQAGFTVEYLRREVGFKAPSIKSPKGKTVPAGWRYPDAAVYYKGELVEYLEFKSSSTAVYSLRQRVRDAWAHATGGPITSVVRPDVLGK